MRCLSKLTPGLPEDGMKTRPLLGSTEKMPSPVPSMNSYLKLLKKYKKIV